MSNRSTKTRIVAATSGLLLAGGVFASSALAYPPGTPLEITGANGVVTVSNGQPGCSVAVYVNGVEAGSGTIGADGTFTLDTSTPAGATLEADVSGTGCDAEVADGTVSSGGRGGGGTARTGSDTTLGIVASLGALGIGGGLVVASRRRKS